ncbi:TolC family protein [Agathobaculum sp.]|uniref:TolC family protein n=1 Tax=Agathobaculum sp. TaxID=2048138 RepID=UPI003AF056F1
MKRKLISALLACALLAGTAAPAFAAEDTADTAAKTPAGIGAEAPALKVRQMGLLAVQKAVTENNSTVRMLRKNASAIESATSGSSSSGGALNPGQAYSQLADTLQGIINDGKLSGDMKKTYEAQIEALRANADNLNFSVSSQMQSAMAMLSQLDDQAYQLRRQADSIANQMAKTAQDLLYTMETMDYQMENLKNGIATLDRNLAVLRVQRSRGMIGQLQLETVENQRIQLVNSQQTLANMREQIGLTLSQLCGLDADTIVEPSTLVMPYEGELDRINAKTGLENAKKNSFDIWSKRVSLRTAQNVYDKDVSGTAEAVKAAEDQLAVTQESVESAYATVIQDMKDSRVSLKAAENALTQAKDDLRLAGVKYKIGTLSKLGCQSAQDSVASAEINVKLAQLEVAQCYSACQWAEQGVLTLPTGV